MAERQQENEQQRRERERREAEQQERREAADQAREEREAEQRRLQQQQENTPERQNTPGEADIEREADRPTPGEAGSAPQGEHHPDVQRQLDRLREAPDEEERMLQARRAQLEETREHDRLVSRGAEAQAELKAWREERGFPTPEELEERGGTAVRRSSARAGAAGERRE